MQAIEAIREIVDISGLTHRQIAQRLDKYDTFVSQILTRGRDPQASTLADVAHACGYRLELVPLDGGAPIVIGEEHDQHEEDSAADRVAQARALVHRAAALLDEEEARG